MSNALAQSLRRARAIVPVVIGERTEYYNILAADLPEAVASALDSAVAEHPGAACAVYEKDIRWVA